MLTDLILDETSAGAVIGPKDGFLVNLSLTRPPDVLTPMPKNGVHFTLRDDRQDVSPGLRNLISYDPHNWATFGGVIWRNASVRYTGELKVVSVPRGSIWAITISDQPFVRTPWPGFRGEAA